MTGARARSGLRRLLAACLIAPALVAVTSSAHAADPVTVGMSAVKTDTKASGTTVTGVLTLRSKSAVQVDPASLVASIDGKEYPVTVKQAPQKDRRSILLIDTSGSMGQQGMATVRTATAEYLKRVPADVKVGVASFASTAGVDLAPTLDRAAAQRVVNGLRARGDTSLYGGVNSAIKALGSTGDRSIVLLSDGADTVADNETAARKDTVATLKAAGVRMDVVRFKTNDPDANRALVSFAAANGGSVVGAGDTAAVSAAFETSAKALEQQVQFSVTSPDVTLGAHAFKIAGEASGTPFEFTRTVNFGAPASPAAPVPTPTDPSVDAAGLGAAAIGDAQSMESRSWVPFASAAFVALALFMLVAAATVPTLQTRRERRLASIDTYVPEARSSRQQVRSAQSSITDQLLGVGDRVMKDRKSTSTTMGYIERADLPLRAGEWFILRCIAVFVTGAIGFVLLSGVPLIGILIGVLAGLLLPPMVLRYLAGRRARKFEAQLPGVLMLVATSLRSGFGLPQSLDAVARDTADPAAKEFGRALAETRIGTDIGDALERMAIRMDSTSMRWTVMAIRIQRDVGGNLADTLTQTAATLREREALRRQVLTLSAEGRLSAYILIGLPIGLFLYMLMVNYDYISLLWTTVFGLIMLGVGLVLLVVGVVWMRQVVKIEV